MTLEQVASDASAPKRFSTLVLSALSRRLDVHLFPRRWFERVAVDTADRILSPIAAGSRHVQLLRRLTRDWLEVEFAVPLAAAGEVLAAVDELCARRHRLALLARPRADPALPRTGGEISVALRRQRLHDRSFNAQLPVQGIPVQHCGTARVRGDFASFARAVVGIEKEISRLGDDLLAEHDARRRMAAMIDGRQHHCIGILLRALPPRVREPGRGHRHGLGRQGFG